MSIDLRLTDIDPPAEEEKRTIYRDLVDLPSTTKLGITIRYFNHYDATLYFQVTASCPNYSFKTINLGSLNSGANAYSNLDEFGTRPKPSSERAETITITLKAYTDSAYTDLLFTKKREVQVVWIDSSTYTIDVANNFDDGTIQGWSAVEEICAGYDSEGVVTDYVLSAPYALRGTGWCQRTAGVGWYEVRTRIEKTFTTPDRPTVFAIFNVRLSLRWVHSSGNVGLKFAEVRRDGTVLVHLGRTFDGNATDYVPRDKWMRIVVPLPRNTTLTLRIIQDSSWEITGSGPGTAEQHNDIRMDDFKIISK